MLGGGRMTTELLTTIGTEGNAVPFTPPGGGKGTPPVPVGKVVAVVVVVMVAVPFA